MLAIAWETELGPAGEQPDEGYPSPSEKNIPLASAGHPLGATFSHSDPGSFFLLGNALKNEPGVNQNHELMIPRPSS